MLKRLELRGYRGFQSHQLDLRPVSIAVGLNNAGKSTLVEALRVLSIVTERIGGLNFRDPPPWTDLPVAHRGVSPSLGGLGIQFQTIAHRYADDPAEATATFSSGESIHLLVNSDGHSFAVIRDSKGQVIRKKGRVLQANFPSIQVLPQISPLDPEESILMDEYVKRNVSSPLASRHFRNQLRQKRTAYKDFRQLSQNTWPGIKILELQGARGNPGNDLTLLVRDRDFVAEIGLMGHGLQMWLQTIWFLSRANPASTVVLDEPDVYMHPDLQRKLIRLVRSMFPQVIVATHSVEIVADVDPSEILIIDRNQPKSRFADTLPSVQRLVERIGGVHNLHLARLWSSRRFILVEGDDLSFLKAVHDKLYPDSEVPLDAIPNSSIGGWDGWPYAVGQNMFIKNSLGRTVRVYCILDSDYHTRNEIQQRMDDASKCRVELHVWDRKEIENYLLIPDVIARVVCKREPGLDLDALANAIGVRIHEIVQSLKDVVFDGYATRFRDRNPPGGVAQANRKARDRLEGVFDDRERALARIPGKEVLSQLSSWLHDHHGRGVTIRDILREILPHEIPQEFRQILEAIEGAKPFK